MLDNDCVIVPGLGGFVAHHVDARFDERDSMFLPPMRTLGFNAKLNMNDSLLAQSYVEAYDISYPEALNRIDTEVDELKQALERDGFYELSDIGVLTINNEGKCEFEPCESGILTPELYGLAGFEINKLVTDGNDKTSKAVIELPLEPKKKHVENSAKKVSDGAETKESPFGESVLVESLTPDESYGEKTISIKVSVLRNVVAVACAIIAFFVMATPITTNMDDNVKEAGSINYSLLYNLVPQSGSSSNTHIINNNVRTKTTPASVVKSRTIEKEVEMSEAKQSETNTKESVLKENQDKTVVISDKQQDVEYYSIVLACRITKKNADAFVERLHSDGYKKACVIGKEGKSLKVIYGSYPTEKDAVAELNTLRGDEVFKDSWIFHVK